MKSVVSSVLDGLGRFWGSVSRSLGGRRLLWTAVLLSNLFIAGLVSLALYSSRQQHMVNAEKAVENLSALLAHDVGNLLDKTDIALQRLGDEFIRQERSGGVDARLMSAFIQAQSVYLPDALGLRMTNADGDVLYSSTGQPLAKVNISDRERFRILRQNPTVGLVMDGPEQGRVSGKWVVIFARRLEHADRSFAGEIHASMEISRLVRLLNQVSLGSSGIASLWDGNKRLVARHPERPVIGGSVMTHAMQGLINAGRTSGSYLDVSRIDGIGRVFHFRQITGRALYLNVGLGDEDSLASWRREAWEFGGMGLLFAALTLVTAFLVDRSLRRQREAARELDRARSDLHAIMDNVPALVGYWDVHLRNRFGNHAYATWFGCDARNMVGRHMREVIGDALFQKNLRHVEGVLAGIPQRFEREINYQGEVRQGFTSYIPDLRDGAVVGFYVLIVDVTSLKQAQEAAAKASRRSQLLLQAASDGIHILDVHGKVLDASESFCQMLGYSRDEMLRMTVFDWEANVAGDELTQLLASLMEQKTTFETLHRCRDGRVLEVEISSIGLEVDGERLLYCSARDITERKSAERTIRETSDRFSKIFHSSPVGIAIARLADGHFQQVNEAFAAMLGLEVEDFPGHNAADMGLWVIPEQRQEFYSLVNSGNCLHSMEIAWFSKAGMVIDLLVSVDQVEIAGVSHLLGFVMDITHQKEAQRALSLYGQQMEEMVEDRTRELRLAQQESERLGRAKSEFLANMSHEIRTPLNAVLGMAQLGRRQSAGRKVEHTFSRILDAGNLLLGTVNDILDFSKIEAGKLELEDGRVTLGELVDRVVDMVAPQAHARRQHFRLTETPDLPVAVSGDGLRLAQVLVNLLNNAVKFTEADGQVGLVVERTQEHLLFRVTDTGIGMSQAQISRLFQPFEQADGSTTRRFGGTGLGLSICKRLVGLMGGEIRVASTMGRGSEFTVCLPMREIPMPTPSAVSGSVALLGLEPGEAEEVRITLAAKGLAASILAADGIVPPGTALIVADDRLAAGLRARTPGAARIALAVAPGPDETHAAELEDAALIYRPLRARHVCALLAGDALATTPHACTGPRLVGMQILAAEDNDVNRAVLEETLAAEGAILTCLENGRLALELAERQGCASFAIVLTDIQMPEMDGYETARRLHALDPELPIIGLTAHALTEERDRCFAAGMVEHVPKPFDIELLVATLLRHARQLPEEAPTPPLPPAAPVVEVPAIVMEAAIDWAKLEQRYRGKPAFVLRILRLALESHASSPADLRAAAAAEDYATVSSLAHKLKGTTGNLMAEACHRLAERTDLLARERDPQSLVLSEELALAVTGLSGEMLARLAAEEASGGPQNP